MFYPQVIESPKTSRKTMEGISRSSRQGSPALTSSPSASPKLNRRSRKNSAPSLTNNPTSPLKNSAHKRDTLKQLEDEIDNLWDEESKEEKRKDVKRRSRKHDHDSERQCASPYFQLGISFPLSPNSSRSSSPINCNRPSSADSTHKMSPLAKKSQGKNTNFTTSSESESEREEKEEKRKGGHERERREDKGQEEIKEREEEVEREEEGKKDIHIVQGIKKLSAPNLSSPLLKATVSPTKGSVTIDTNARSNEQPSDGEIKKTKTTPPKKPPRVRTRPLSTSTTPINDDNNGLGALIEGPFSNSQRFRPYMKKLSEPILEHTPHLVSDNVSSRLADLESSLESSFRGNSTTTPDDNNGLGALIEGSFSNSQRFRPYMKKLASPLVPEEVSSQLADLESSLESSFHGNGIVSPFPLKSEESDSSFNNEKTNAEKSPSHSPAHKPSYPWRNMGGANLNKVGMTNSIFPMNDLEYSLEPRNWSRPKIKSPSPINSITEEDRGSSFEEISREVIQEVKREEEGKKGMGTFKKEEKGEKKENDEVTSKKEEKEMIKEGDERQEKKGEDVEKDSQKKENEETKKDDKHDSEIQKEEKKEVEKSEIKKKKYKRYDNTIDSFDVISLNHEAITAKESRSTSSKTKSRSPFVQIKNNHEPLVSNSDDRGFLETGVYDKLLPLSPGSPLLSSSPSHAPPDQTTPIPGTFPGKSITNSSPKILRRQSADNVTSSSDRRHRASKEKGRERRKRIISGCGPDSIATNYDDVTLRKSMSPSSSLDGTEESLNWNYMDPAAYDKGTTTNGGPAKPPPVQRRPSIFSGLFGEKHDIYNPKNASNIQTKYLARDSSKVNLPNENGDTPLHCYIKSDRQDRLELVLTLLVHCNIKLMDINPTDSNGDTPLHIAVKFNDEWCIKALLAFGADINSLNHKQQTPLDLVMSQVQVPHSDSFDKLHELLSQLHAIPGWVNKKPRLLDESLNSLINESYEIDETIKLGEYLDERRRAAFVFKLEELLNQQHLEFSLNTGISMPPGLSEHHHGVFFDPIISRQMQLQNISKWKATIEFRKGAGSRLLFLDGGGIRGLIQIEILKRIERMTGRKITELFDWIIGSSTGGIIALCLVYLNMSLEELRQLYFQLREEVFVGGFFSISKRTEVLEQILKKHFQDKRMSDVEYPKVLISAVSSKTSPPELHFFNNCFNNEYSDALVWKVARYTSAGPTYFTECDDFLDGGVLANNPCVTAWVEIERYHEINFLPKPKVAMAISVGTGSYPREILGETDLFGKGWLDLRGTFRRAHRFIKMLSTALVESENVAKIFATTCSALEIKFLRFSPALTISVKPDETDSKVLLDMIIRTQIYLHTQSCQQDLDKVVRHFRHLAEVSRGLNLNK